MAGSKVSPCFSGNQAGVFHVLSRPYFSPVVYRNVRDVTLNGENLIANVFRCVFCLPARKRFFSVPRLQAGSSDSHGFTCSAADSGDFPANGSRFHCICRKTYPPGQETRQICVPGCNAGNPLTGNEQTPERFIRSGVIRSLLYYSAR